MSSADLAAAAAFTAAGVALFVGVFGVIWGARRASRAQLEQWRRNEERPIVARMLTLSEDVFRRWGQAEAARRRWIESASEGPDRGQVDTKARDEARDHWEAATELYDKLRFEAAQLELIADRPVRDVAAKLIRAHEGPQHWLRPASPTDDPFELLSKQNRVILGLHAELVEKTRTDLGLPTRDR